MKTHPFQNNGASSGICTVCGGIAPEHHDVLLSDGTVSPLLTYQPKPYRLDGPIFFEDENGNVGQAAYSDIDISKYSYMGISRK